MLVWYVARRSGGKGIYWDGCWPVRFLGDARLMEERGRESGRVRGEMKGVRFSRQIYTGRKCIINKGDDEGW